MSELQENIITAIKTITDPELPINIYDRGLIRKIEIENGTVVKLEGTFSDSREGRGLE